MDSYSGVLSERERAQKKTKILKDIALEYKNGVDAKKLLEKYGPNYLEETGDALSLIAIRAAIASYVDGTSLREKKKKTREEAKRLRGIGLTTKQICEQLGFSQSYINTILREETIPTVKKTEKADKPLTQFDIDKFASDVKCGDTLPVVMQVKLEETFGLGIKTQTVRTRLKIVEKYRHHCITDRGDFRWLDLYIWAKEHEKQGTRFQEMDGKV